MLQIWKRWYVLWLCDDKDDYDAVLNKYSAEGWIVHTITSQRTTGHDGTWSIRHQVFLVRND